MRKINKNVIREYARMATTELLLAIVTKLQGKNKQTKLHLNGCRLATRAVIRMVGGSK